MKNIYLRKSELVLSIVGAAFFVLIGLYVVIDASVATDAVSEFDRIGGIVLGCIVILFFGGILLYAVMMYFKLGGHPIVTMDEQGFFDRRYFHQPVLWTDIRSAYIFRGKTAPASVNRFISLDIIEPERYIKKTFSHRFPMIFKLLHKVYDEPGVSISASLLDISTDGLLSAIKEESKGLVRIEN